jgi:hypothetical protein
VIRSDPSQCPPGLVYTQPRRANGPTSKSSIETGAIVADEPDNSETPKEPSSQGIKLITIDDEDDEWAMPDEWVIGHPKHHEAVDKFLEENVRRPDTPREIRLHSFNLQSQNPPSWGFTLSLDGEDFEGFSYTISGWSGKPVFFVPMFHSPLGAPCSYDAVELTPETESALNDIIERLFPKLRPVGEDPETGQVIDRFTSYKDRLSAPEEYERTMKALGSQTL